MKRNRKLRYQCEYFVFRLLVCLLNALSARQTKWLAEKLAVLFHRVLPRRMTRYNVAFQNIRLAFGDRYSDQQVDRMIFQMWVHLFRMVAEMVQLPRKMRLYNVLDVLQFHNRDAMVRALCTGRPIMIVTGHFGNWEMANCASGFFGFPMGVVARDLDNPHLHDWFCRYRVATGHRLISKKGGTGGMREMLQQRGTVGLLCDQDAGSRGMFVPFFGQPASTFKSIALLALEHKAVMCIVVARRLKDDFNKHRWVRYEMGCEDVIDCAQTVTNDPAREVTERYTAALERAVRRSPEQYFWVHRRWKTQPAQGRSKAA